MKLVIIGGVAGGASAAARARRISETADIVLLERGPDVSFANCGLPYYLGGKITDRSRLLVVTPDLLRQRFRLDVRTRSNVERVDRGKKQVEIRCLESGRVYAEPYDKLILAPGAAPFRPNIPGVDLPNVFSLRNLQDTDAIFAALQNVRRVLILGAGFIGLEVAENMIARGLQTTLVELAPQVLAPLDPEMTTPIVQTLRQHGVRLKLGASAQAIHQTATGLSVALSNGQELETDLVLIGVGVRPENGLAAEAGLTLGPRGGIRVDDRMRTNDPDVFAVGDAVETFDFVTGEPAQVPLAGPANRQGRIAADNALGRDVRFRGTQGTAILGMFGKTAAITGASEKVLRRLNRPFRKIYIHPNDHAGYYPGAESMTIKLLFDPEDGRILGGQAVGGAGVDKRIDGLAIAIHARMSVFDLEELELAYAPQFGSAKDPLNMAGFVAAGLLRGDHPQVDVLPSGERPADDPAFLLDVRTPAEFAAGHLPNATNVPVDALRQRLSEIPTDRPVLAYCKVGQRGYLATRILTQDGRNAANLSGGYTTWQLHRPPESD